MFRPNQDSIKAGSPWPRSMPARIVVAEHDAALRELVVSQLLDDGHEVYGASTAPELLHLLARGGCTIPPLDGADLIVLDDDLPGTSGLAIVRRLRAAHSPIAMLLITADPTARKMREAKELRVPVLIRPFSLWHLSCAAQVLLVTAASQKNDAPAAGAS